MFVLGGIQKPINQAEKNEYPSQQTFNNILNSKNWTMISVENGITFM